MSDNECKKRCKSAYECDNSCIEEDAKPITISEVIEVIKAVHYKTEIQIIKALEKRFGDNKRGENDGS